MKILGMISHYLHVQRVERSRSSRAISLRRTADAVRHILVRSVAWPWSTVSTIQVNLQSFNFSKSRKFYIIRSMNFLLFATQETKKPFNILTSRNLDLTEPKRPDHSFPGPTRPSSFCSQSITGNFLIFYYSARKVGRAFDFGFFCCCCFSWGRGVMCMPHRVPEISV